MTDNAKLSPERLKEIAAKYDPKREMEYKCRCGNVTTRPIYWGFPLTCICPEPRFEFTAEVTSQGDIPQTAKDILKLLAHIASLERERDEAKRIKENDEAFISKLAKKCDAAEASLAQAQKRVGQLEKWLDKRGIRIDVNAEEQ